MKTQIKRSWQIAWRLGLVIFVFFLLSIMNATGVQFGFHFDFKSIPKPKESRPKALEASLYAYPFVRYRNKSAFSLHIPPFQNINPPLPN